MSKQFTKARLRPGVTLIEVLFATGIAVFGLVGIASLIAVGARQASDANNSSEGQVAGQIAYNDFLAHGFNRFSRWRRFNDLTGSFDPQTYNPAASIQKRVDAAGGVRTPNRHAVCIDPIFFSDRETLASITTTNFADAQTRRPGLFPYYQDNYAPETNALGSINHARLLRMTVSGFTAKAIERVFQIGDQLVIAKSEDDKTLPAERLFSELQLQSLINGEYSWFATLCPREFGGSEFPVTNRAEDFYTLSVAICKRRDRTFPTAVQPVGKLGERVFSVSATTAFVGGSGGQVTLSGNIAVDGSMRVGDWIMLSRSQTVAGVEGTICRWYRIIATDVELTPNLATGIWARNVILDGPDWVFGGEPTQATLVDGVVAVIERIVPVRP